MRKRDELTDPKSCMSRATDDEMTFVLIGRDVTAPNTIRFWVCERIRLGKNKADDPQIVEALACADQMVRDRRRVELAEKKSVNGLDAYEANEFDRLQEEYFNRLDKLFPWTEAKV